MQSWPRKASVVNHSRHRSAAAIFIFSLAVSFSFFCLTPLNQYHRFSIISFFNLDDAENVTEPCDWAVSFRDSDYNLNKHTAASVREPEIVHQRPAIARNRNLIKFNFTINQPEMCRDSAPLLMVYVHSKPTRFRQRQFIRSTWGHPRFREPFNIRIVFVIGEQCKSPQEFFTSTENVG